MSAAPEAVTVFLQQASQGDQDAFDHLFSLVYQELQHLAHKVRSDRSSSEMSTVSLVHEAYFKLVPSQHMAWTDRVHFYRVAARAMRQVLVNEAEHRMAAKRGGGAVHVTLGDVGSGNSMSLEEVLALNDALDQLERMDARQAQVVEYRVFGGFTVAEIAKMLEVSAATIKRDWAAARAWLAVQMRPQRVGE